MQEERKVHFSLSSLSLKIIAAVLMTLDHVALFFIDNNGLSGVINAYYILRAIGKISFPIFAYLAFDSINKATHKKKYLITLFSFAIFLDLIGYVMTKIAKISIATSPFIGNVFFDLFLGTLTVYLLNKRNYFSLFAILPVSYAILSNLKISDYYGTLFKTDWGSFSITFFILLFALNEIYKIYIRRQSSLLQVDESSLTSSNLPYNALASVALFITEAVFYLIYSIDNNSTFISNEFVPIGTYSTLAIIFFFLYNGKRGKDNKIIRYSFYLYYPLHLLILGVFSLCFGVLRTI